MQHASVARARSSVMAGVRGLAILQLALVRVHVPRCSLGLASVRCSFVRFSTFCRSGDYVFAFTAC